MTIDAGDMDSCSKYGHKTWLGTHEMIIFHCEINDADTDMRI